MDVTFSDLDWPYELSEEQARRVVEELLAADVPSVEEAQLAIRIQGVWEGTLEAVRMTPHDQMSAALLPHVERLATKDADDVQRLEQLAQGLRRRLGEAADDSGAPA